MATTLKRYSITETDDISSALDVAASAWPEHAGQRSILLRHLVLAGAEVAQREQAERLAAPRATTNRLSGSRAGIWPSDALEELRGDWSE
jgi:hypothetical protein